MFAPQRYKMYRLTWAPNQDCNQPAHPRSLIRVSVVRLKKLYILAQTDLNLCWADVSMIYFQTLRLTELWGITKTCLYNFDPLKPHFNIVKLGFTGIYIIFFFFRLKNIDCGYSLESPRRGGSNECPQSMFWAEIWNLSEFLIWKFSVFEGEIFYIFE